MGASRRCRSRGRRGDKGALPRIHDRAALPRPPSAPQPAPAAHLVHPLLRLVRSLYLDQCPLYRRRHRQPLRRILHFRPREPARKHYKLSLHRSVRAAGTALGGYVFGGRVRAGVRVRHLDTRGGCSVRVAFQCLLSGGLELPRLPLSGVLPHPRTHLCHGLAGSIGSPGRYECAVRKRQPGEECAPAALRHQRLLHPRRAGRLAAALRHYGSHVGRNGRKRRGRGCSGCDGRDGRGDGVEQGFCHLLAHQDFFRVG
mmetsp:Transcript_19203/g.42763  ORF Transcript_19203/g.42763 Transcript_19203/m.42763 type:complete len:257 (-) Transcript_19203:693-1463(-)